MTRDEAIIKKHTEDGYKYGFTTDIDQERAEIGLNEDTIRYISAKKNEPKWLLDWRLKAFDVWEKMDSPDWAHLDIPEIDYQSISYYASSCLLYTSDAADES